MVISEVMQLIKAIHAQPTNQELLDRFMQVLESADEWLLNANSVHIEGVGKLTPLMYAAYLGCTEAIKLLLQYPQIVKLQVITESNSLEYSALDWAFANKTQNPFTIDLLLRAGAKTADEIIATKNTQNPNNAERDVQNFVNNVQNTHDHILEESIYKSIKNLAARYPIENTAAIIEQIKQCVDQCPTAEKERLYNFLQHDYMNQNYSIASADGKLKINSPYTLTQILCLVWQATIDAVEFKDPATPSSDNDPRSDRIRILFKRMIDSLRGTGICCDGRCQALIETLDRVHSDVALNLGKAAIKEILEMRFNRLFQQRLLANPNAKQLILNFEADDEAADFLEYFKTEKAAIIALLRAEYPLAFKDGLIGTGENAANGDEVRVNPDKYFNDLEAINIAVNDMIPGLRNIRELEVFHSWMSTFSTAASQANNLQQIQLNAKRQTLSKFIANSMAPTNKASFADIYTNIVVEASKLYPKSGWIELISKKNTLPYFTNLMLLINKLPENIRIEIFTILQQLDSGNEAALDPILDRVNAYLLHAENPNSEVQLVNLMPEDPVKQRELLKQTLCNISAVNPHKKTDEFELQFQFITTYKRNKIKLKILAEKNIGTWLNEQQLENLVDELEDCAEAEQANILQLLRLLYVSLHSESEPVRQKALTNLSAALADPENTAKNSATFQTQLLHDHDKQRNNILHLITGCNDTAVFNYLHQLSDKNPVEFARSIRALNSAGFDPLRLACGQKNIEFLKFIHNFDIIDDLIDVKALKYNDSAAMIFLLEFYLNQEPENLTQLKSIEELCCSDLRIELLDWLLQKQYSLKLKLVIFNNSITYGMPKAVEAICKLTSEPIILSYLYEEYLSEHTNINNISEMFNAGFVNVAEVLIKYCPDDKKEELFIKKLGHTNTSGLESTLECNLPHLAQLMLNSCPSKLIRQFLGGTPVNGRPGGNNYGGPLCLAAEFCTVDTINMLINTWKSKVDNDTTQLLQQIGPNNATVFHYAAKSNNVANLNLLAQQLPDASLQDLIRKKTTCNETALHFSVKKNAHKTTQALLDLIKSKYAKKAFMLELATTKHLQTALHYASYSDDKMVKILLENWPDADKTEFLEICDKIGDTALHNATPGSIKILMDNCLDDRKLAYITTKNTNEETSLHIAATKNIENIKALIKAYPKDDKTDFIIATNKNGETAIHKAIFSLRINNITYMLELLEETTQTKIMTMANGDGITAIHMLIEKLPLYTALRLTQEYNNNLDLAKFYLAKLSVEARNKILTVKDKSGKSLLNKLIDSGQIDLVVSYMPDVPIKDRINALADLEADGESILHTLIKRYQQTNSKTDCENLLKIINCIKNDAEATAALSKEVNQTANNTVISVVALAMTPRHDLLAEGIFKNLNNTNLFTAMIKKSNLCQWYNNPDSDRIKTMLKMLDHNQQLQFYDTLMDGILSQGWEAYTPPKGKHSNILKCFAPELMFEPNNSIKAKNLNYYITSQHILCINELKKHAGIKVDDYTNCEKTQTKLLEKYHPHSSKQIKARKLILAILRQNPLNIPTDLNTTKCLYFTNKLFVNGTDAALRAQCVQIATSINNAQVKAAALELINTIPNTPRAAISEQEREFKNQLRARLANYCYDRKTSLFNKFFSFTATNRHHNLDLAQILLHKIVADAPELSINEILDEHIGYRKFSHGYCEAGSDRPINSTYLNAIIRDAKAMVVDLDISQSTSLRNKQCTLNTSSDFLALVRNVKRKR